VAAAAVMELLAGKPVMADRASKRHSDSVLEVLLVAISALKVEVDTYSRHQDLRHHIQAPTVQKTNHPIQDPLVSRQGPPDGCGQSTAPPIVIDFPPWEIVGLERA